MAEPKRHPLLRLTVVLKVLARRLAPVHWPVHRTLLRLTAILLACCFIGTGSLVVVGYLLQAPAFVSWGLATAPNFTHETFPPGMALNTAILFIVVGISFLVILALQDGDR